MKNDSERANYFYVAVLAPVVAAVLAGGVAFWVTLVIGWAWVLVGPSVVVMYDALRAWRRERRSGPLWH